MPPDLTVCIPAYRSLFLAATLGSVQRQSYADFQVEIAIEPPGLETVAECALVTGDSRFHWQVNPVRLGWDRNIAALLSRVRTPYFVILPHDDLLHPDYLSILRGALEERPGAAVAYGDMLTFGAVSHGKRLALADGTLFERLRSFFAGGAEAVPWRGVTRRSVLAGGATFRTNRHQGFAVECEWALHLLRCGAARRVAKTLYLKRLPEAAVETVSGGWTRMPPAELRAALAHHRLRMLRGSADRSFEAAERRILRLACEAAMLRRFALFAAGRFSFEDAHRARAAATLDGLARSGDPQAASLRAMTLTALALDAGARGAPGEAETLLRRALESDPLHWEARRALAQLLETDRAPEALACARAVAGQGGA